MLEIILLLDKCSCMSRHVGNFQSIYFDVILCELIPRNVGLAQKKSSRNLRLDFMWRFEKVTAIVGSEDAKVRFVSLCP